MPQFHCQRFHCEKNVKNVYKKMTKVRHFLVRNAWYAADTSCENSVVKCIECSLLIQLLPWLNTIRDIEAAIPEIYNTKWNTNTEKIVKKAAKRLFLLKV